MPEMEQYLSANMAKFDAELCDFLRIGSISADPSRKAEVASAARWVATQFEHMGFATETIPTAGHPLVYAESPEVPGAPTVLDLRALRRAASRSAGPLDHPAV